MKKRKLDLKKKAELLIILTIAAEHLNESAMMCSVLF